MQYKATCPSCGKRISRWHIFCEPTIYHRCRGCEAKVGMGPAARLAMGGFLALHLLWYVLARKHIISPLIAIALVSATLALTVWLLPYLISVRLKKEQS